MYRLLWVLRVGSQPSRSWSKSALWCSSSSFLRNMTHHQQPWAHGTARASLVMCKGDGGVGWQPRAACNIMVPSGSHFTCTGTAETLELGIGEKLVQLGMWAEKVPRRCEPPLGSTGFFWRGMVFPALLMKQQQDSCQRTGETMQFN